MNNHNRKRINLVARAICLSCGENPDDSGGNGNEFRWQDYISIAIAAIESADIDGKENEEMERALKIIAVWSDVWKDSPESIEKQFSDIKNLALKAIGRR